MTQPTENLKQQMQRLKLRFKDILHREVVVLRTLRTNGGAEYPAGTHMAVEGHHHGRLIFGGISRVSTTSVALVRPYAINPKRNFADAVRKHGEALKGARVILLRPRSGVPVGTAGVVESPTSESPGYTRSTHLSATFGKSLLYLSHDEVELAGEIEKA